MHNQHYHAKMFKEIQKLSKEDVIHLYKNHVLLEKEINEAEKVLSHLIYSSAEFHELFNFIAAHTPEKNQAGKPIRKILLDFLLALKSNDEYFYKNAHFNEFPEEYKKTK